MKLADVEFSWVPSASEDVVQVEFVLADMDGEILDEAVLASDIDSHVVQGLEERGTYVATVTVSDGWSEASTSIEVNIPDLEAPLAVTELGFEIVAVYDAEVEEEEELEEEE